MKSKTSEALEYFLNEQRLCDEIDSPDTGIDYAFMLQPSDWEILLTKWDAYSDEWKSAIIYYTGFTYLKEGAPLLLKALQHTNEEIVMQALFSIYESMSAENENTILKKGNQNIAYTFSKEEKQKILEALILRENEFELYPELGELQNLMGSF